MSKRVLVMLLVGVMMMGMMGAPVMAQVTSDSGTNVGSDEVPDPESAFFGLQWAWMRVSQNIQLWTTRSEEKQADLEARFAAQEQALIERIGESDNPERLQSLLESLQERQSRRLERLNVRIERIGEKRSEQAGKLLDKLESIEERRFEASESARRRLEEKRESVNDKIETRREELKKEAESRREELKKTMEERRERMEERMHDEDDGEVEGASTFGWVNGVVSGLGLEIF